MERALDFIAAESSRSHPAPAITCSMGWAIRFAALFKIPARFQASTLSFNHNNAGGGSVFGWLHLEMGSQVKDGDYLIPEVDYSLYG
ncbi:MAG: hypothetical protein OEL55_06595, partial [Desulfobulbaceae bacterium]|nr:hypothetical protein [Desulfobulbaceae bacterium]